MCSILKILNFNKVNYPVSIFLNLKKIKNLTKLAPIISPTGLLAKDVIEKFDQQITTFKTLPITLVLVLQKQKNVSFHSAVKIIALNSFSVFSLFNYLDFYKFCLINYTLSKSK